MKITVLAENKGPESLNAEHGLSLFIEYNGKKYLLDTGAGDAFYKNAQLLGLDLTDVDYAFISHAHNDHAGGLAFFLSWNRKATVFISENASASCWKVKSDGKSYIGIPPHFLTGFAQRLSFVSEKSEVRPNIWMLPHTTAGLSERGERAALYVERDGELVPDDFRHENTVVFDTKDGLVIFSSCSHAGADNTVREVLENFPGKKVYAFFGGFHIMGPEGVTTLGVPEEDVTRLAKAMRAFDIPHLYTGHCTGDPGFKILKETLGDGLHYMSTGTVIEI